MKLKATLLLLASTGTIVAADGVTAGQPATEFRIVDPAPNRFPDPLDAELRHLTVIRMPPGETAVQVSSGDPGMEDKPGSGDWLVGISATGDAVLVKPTKPGTETNLDILTDLKHRYALLIRDHSFDRNYHCRLENILIASELSPKVVPTEKLDAANAENERLRQKVTTAQEEITKLRESMAQAAAKPKDSAAAPEMATLSIPAGCVQEYRFDRAQKDPWGVDTICHDKHFTYIRTTKNAEHFAVYPLEGGMPSLADSDYWPDQNIYVIHKVIAQGRLQLGSGKKTKHVDFALAAKHGG